MTVTYVMTLADADADWLAANGTGQLVIGPQGDIHAGCVVKGLINVGNVSALFDEVMELRHRVKALEADTPQGRRVQDDRVRAYPRTSLWSEENGS